MLNKPVMFIAIEMTPVQGGVDCFTTMSPDWNMLRDIVRGKVLTVISGDTHTFKVYAPRYASQNVTNAVVEYADKIIKEQAAINAKRRPVNR